MKKNIRKICILAVLLLCFMHCGVFFAYGAESGKYTLFVNDEPWYTESLYGWQKINQVYYVPITVFYKIDGVEINSNPDLNTVTISYGKKYISIDMNDKKFAYTEEYGEFYFKTYDSKTGIIYVPAITVCQYFGFSFATHEGTKAIRITDGKERLTFYEVLLIYNPSLVLKEQGGYKYNPINSDANVAYFMFDVSSDANVPEILSMLKRSNAKATFFMNRKTVTKFGNAVRQMIIEGHTVGLLPEKDIADADELISNIEKANEALYAVSHTKTRIVKLSDDCGFVPSTEDAEKLAKNGYVLWGNNLDSYDTSWSDSGNVVREVAENLIKYKSVAVRFHDGKTAADALNTLLMYINTNTDYKLLSVGAAMDSPFYK